MENVKQKCFLQSDHQGFLKDVEVRLIDKTQTSDPTKREFYWMRTLRTLYLDVLNIESDYQQAFQTTRTFTVMFGCLSTRVLSSVIAIAFFEFCLFGCISEGHALCITHRFQ